MKLYFVLLMKSHFQSYPCPLQINSFWNLGFLLGITIILQIITGILLGLHYTSDINSAYFSVFFFIREIYYGWCLHYLHSTGASFVFLFLLLHLGRAICYGSYFYNQIALEKSFINVWSQRNNPLEVERKLCLEIRDSKEMLSLEMCSRILQCHPVTDHR